MRITPINIAWRDLSSHRWDSGDYKAIVRRAIFHERIEDDYPFSEFENWEIKIHDIRFGAFYKENDGSTGISLTVGWEAEPVIHTIEEMVDILINEGVERQTIQYVCCINGETRETLEDILEVHSGHKDFRALSGWDEMCYK